MKRISFLVLTIVALMASTGGARHSVPYSSRITYSPYAFDRNNNGLIPGCMKYSPYAFDRGQSGLVYETTRYSPYAYEFGTNGLISDGGVCYVPCFGYNGGLDQADAPLARAVEHLASSIEGAAGQVQTPFTTPSYPRRIPTTSPKRVVKWGQPAWIDQRRVVNDYLRQRCDVPFYITRLLRIDGDVVSFDLVLDDRNMVVKYWNPGKIQWVKREDPRKEKTYMTYLTSWLDCRDDYRARGFAIQHIASNDSDEVISQLAGYLKPVEPPKG